MKKTIFKNLITVCMALVMVLMCFALIPNNVDAATSCKITGAGTYTVGSEVTIKVTYTGTKLYAVKSNLTYDSRYFTYKSSTATQVNGSGGSLTILQESDDIKGTSSLTFSATFTAKKAGSFNLKNIVKEVCDANGNVSETEFTTTAKIICKDYEASTNNYLSKLTVSPGTISPSFKKTVQEYHLTVDSSVDEIVVSVKKADSKATVEGAGKIKLSETNNISIVVTAESGDTRTYTIIVGELDPLQIMIDKKIHMISETIDKELVPDGFEIVKLKRGDKEFEGIKAKDSDYTLAYLTYEDTSTWYFYNTETETVSLTSTLNSEDLFFYTKSMLASATQPIISKESFDDSPFIMLMCVTGGLLLIFVIILQAVIIKQKKNLADIIHKPKHSKED